MTKRCICFAASARDRFKALYWDGDGFLLLYKRIEKGHLQWPTNQDAVRALQPAQLERLLTGWSIDPTIHQFQPTFGR